MRPKLKDQVKHPEKDILGQIERIRSGLACITYGTCETLRVHVKKLEWTGQYWRIND